MKETMTDAKQRSGAWAFELDRLESWAYWDNVFTPEECERIVAIGKKLRPKKATTLSAEEGVRDSKVSWIQPSADTNWIFERVTGVVMSLNTQFFMFDLFGMLEGFQFTEYNAPSGHYGMHVDKGKGILVRKLSVTIQLSDSEDYEGGELMLQYAKTPEKAPTDQGKAIVFPSYTLHEVRPVTKGTRYSLVCWVSGKAFV
jgi:PKHD-type hydroxylase